jgi:hypothetical protein
MRCWAGISHSSPWNIGRESAHSKKEGIGLGKPGISEKSRGANLRAKIASFVIYIPYQ